MRLLVIDDEEDLCAMIAEVAEKKGFDVTTISDPARVAGEVLRAVPDVILLDLMMPGTDGVELLRLLSDHVRESKIALMSGSDARVLSSARRLGNAHGLNVVATLEKPIDVGALRTLLDQIAEPPALAPARSSGESRLAQAIASGEFLLYYQPVVNIATRSVKGAEALMRWNHPTRGILAPDSFLDQITQEGLMQPLTEFAITSAVRQSAAWDRAGYSLTVSINVTASSLLELGLPDRIASQCLQNNVHPESLVIEVTETEAMRDVTRTMDVLLRMRLRNIGVSVDDFGTGHSSLRELQRMPFSEMKIDKSFVMGMVDHPDCAVIVKAIIDLGHNLGLRIIAEGVENEEIWSQLAARGCDFAQGIYMSPPIPPDAFERWLAGWNAT